VVKILIVLSILASPSIVKAQKSSPKPLGHLRVCTLVKTQLCCEWHYVADRFCTRLKEDACAPAQRAQDSMNALRVKKTWCYRALGVWDLKSETRYSHWAPLDRWSRANRKVRRLLEEKKYYKAKASAKRMLRRLRHRGLCVKKVPCDDHLEFVARAPLRELKKAVHEWGPTPCQCYVPNLCDESGLRVSHNDM